MTEPGIRVAYLGNFRHPWCTEVHVAASLRALGHTVIELQEDRTDWADMLQLVDDARAQVLLWTRTWPAELDKVKPVLDELRARGVPAVSYHLDRWFGLDREHQVTDQPFFHTSLVVSPDDSPRWAEHGIDHLWLPPGVFHAETDAGDPGGRVAPNPRRWPYDVVFVGSFPYPHAEWAAYRGDLIRHFTLAFGDRFAVLPRKGQPIRGTRLRELYATVPVILGDSCLAGESHRYWSDRIPETLGRGGLLIHPEVGTDVGPAGDWYQGTELGKDGPIPSIDAIPDLLTYPLGDFASAVFQARAALDEYDALRVISKKGAATVAGRDTYVHRMETVLATVEERLGWRDAPPPAANPTTPRARASGGPRRAIRRVDRPAAVPGRINARCGPRLRGQFDPRPDVETDAQVIAEVWESNDYRIPTHGMKGTVLDVGANIGAFTVAAAKAGAQKVIAVEPHPGNRERLWHHLILNGIEDRATVEERAVVGGKWAGGEMFLGGTGGGVHAITDPADPFYEDPATVRALTVPLTELIIEHAPLSFVKVDIEGGEYDAFLGVTAHLLHESVEAMALEFHGPGMPHLGHLGPDVEHVARWSQLVAMLADCGRLEIMGHPTIGGLIWWRRY